MKCDPFRVGILFSTVPGAAPRRSRAFALPPAFIFLPFGDVGARHFIEDIYFLLHSYRKEIKTRMRTRGGEGWLS